MKKMLSLIVFATSMLLGNTSCKKCIDCSYKQFVQDEIMFSTKQLCGSGRDLKNKVASYEAQGWVCVKVK